MGAVPGAMIIMVIVIMVIVVMGMTMMAVVVMAMMMMMMMTAPGQQHGADQIDPQTENGDEGRLAEGDRARVEQAGDGLTGDPERDDAQHQRRGEAGQVAHLPGPEAEAPVRRVALGIGVGSGRDRQGAGVGGHVEAVGQQGHRAIDHAGDDLADHHDGGQADDPKRSPRALVVRPAEEMVVVGQIVGLGGGHDAGFTWNSGG